MAKALAKKTALENETALANLRKGMIISSALYLILRVLNPWKTFPPTFYQTLVYIVTLLPTLFLYQLLHSMGTPRRDASGTLISFGEDLNQPGLMELYWDVIYVTWSCQVGSSLFGDRFWWFYASIPLYGAFKLYSLAFGSPFSAPKVSAEAEVNPITTEAPKDGMSNRQAKMQKRNDKIEAMQKKSTRR